MKEQESIPNQANDYVQDIEYAYVLQLHLELQQKQYKAEESGSLCDEIAVFLAEERFLKEVERIYGKENL